MRLLDRALSRHIGQGALEIVYADGKRSRFGQAGAAAVVIRFADRGAPWRVLRDPRLGAGEMYREGRLTVDPPHDVYDLVDLVSMNGKWEIPGEDRKLLRKRGLGIMARIERFNARRGARRNVAHHYDLNDRLYDLFLDADRQYSCAYFEMPSQSLEEAQSAKKRHIAAKLLVKPGSRVFDIGCGWGSLAFYFAEICSAEVTGATLSKMQAARANTRAHASGLGNRVEFRGDDYREVKGSFDRIVAIEMIENIGVGSSDMFFRKCAELLAEDGLMLLQSSVRREGPEITNPFISKYVFPGSHIPALSELLPAIERAGLLVTDIEFLRLHYAETLRVWRERFLAHRQDIERLYDDRFFRAWEFCLSCSEMAFRKQGAVPVQIQMAKRQGVVPITREYIGSEEARLRGIEAEDRSALRSRAN
jgi:cyclopropane-fatty-acyl-phospholipid synthase